MKYYFNNELRSATLFHVMLSTILKVSEMMISSSSKRSQTTWGKNEELHRNHGDHDRVDIDNDSCHVVDRFYVPGTILGVLPT